MYEIVDNLEIVRVKVKFLAYVFGNINECNFDNDDLLAISTHLAEIEEELEKNIKLLEEKDEKCRAI